MIPVSVRRGVSRRRLMAAGVGAAASAATADLQAADVIERSKALFPAMKTIKTRIDANVVYATIDNPPLNLVGAAFVTDLIRLLDALDADESYKVVVFSSADPDFFLSRADVSHVADYTAAAAASGGPGDSFLGTLYRRLSETRTITIAQVAGRARGAGSEFALACDMRFASIERAIFEQPEASMGLMPGSGGVQHLTRLLGRGRALEVLLGAEDFNAGLAERYGWINRALPDDELASFVSALARRIAAFPTAALKLNKERVNAIALPPVDTVRSDAVIFQALARSDATKDRLQQLMQRGMDTRGETELEFGRVLGDLK